MKFLSKCTPKMNVWCGFLHDHVVGSFFFAKNFIKGGKICLDMLELFAFLQTEDTDSGK
jgi:hypothetical protein